jgi:hypothetical protein
MREYRTPYVVRVTACKSWSGTERTRRNRLRAEACTRLMRARPTTSLQGAFKARHSRVRPCCALGAAPTVHAALCTSCRTAVTHVGYCAFLRVVDSRLSLGSFNGSEGSVSEGEQPPPSML